jgi:hypothetical protein
MTRAEEVVRSTTRAIASTVQNVPPLTLEPAPDELRSHGHRRPRRPGLRTGARPGRWRSWLGPAGAVVTVVAVAVALVIVRDMPSGRVAPRATQTTPAAPAGVPEYYVAWMPADRPSLMVGNTMTGARLSTVTSPSGVSLESVFGTAADDRTFVVTGDRPVGASAGVQWYLLRISPGSRTTARLVPLPIPVRQEPAGVALSPDGTRLAVALPGTPADLRIYSVATGALLRTWSAPAGQIKTATVTPGSWQFSAMVLRWSADGRTLAFTWNAQEIRALDPTAPDGNLLTRSSLLAGIGTGYTPAGTSITCSPARGWAVVADGRGTVCAATWSAGTALPGSGSSPASARTCTSGQRISYGFELETPYGQGGREGRLLAPVAGCPGQAQPSDGAYLGWANADGSILIGLQAWNGHVRFGIFRGSRFTPLPAAPAPRLLPTGPLVGIAAW